MAPLASPPLLTVAEKLVPSVLTSALLFVAVGLNAPPFAGTSIMTLAFFALLPTLVSVAFVQDELLLQPFKRAFITAFRCSDPLSDDAEGTSAVAKTLAQARAELSRALLECWHTPRTGPTAPVLSPALVALQQQQQQQQHHRLRDRKRRHAHKSVHSSSSELLTSSSTSHKPKSLYDQVKATLSDHTFANTESPIYCMDPSTGRFLHVNAQHKLVFTNVPDAACLFYVERGKTHHWGLRSAVYQRFVGQTFVGKVCVNAKKLQGWEAFRVLERPDDVINDASDGMTQSPTPPQRSVNDASKTIYLILCSSRFGKGMWLAKEPVSEKGGDSIGLSKRFAHALALVYATDLSAFEYLANEQFLQSARRRSDGRLDKTAKGAIEPLTVACGSVLHAPKLIASSETSTNKRMQLPWIDDVINAKRFFQLPEKQLLEVAALTLTRSTVKDVVALCTSDDDAIHSTNAQLHATFGFVSTHCYRPDNHALPGTLPGKSQLPENARVAVALDVFVSCLLPEASKPLDRATLRIKLFPVGASAFSNNVSIEVLFEFMDLADTTTGGPSPVNLPVLQLHCRAGVSHAVGMTATSAKQVELAAIESVKRACDVIVSGLRAARSHVGGSSSHAPSEKVQHVLAIEVARGLLGLSDGPHLPLVLPWQPVLPPVAAPLQALAAATSAIAPSIPAPTAFAFFQSLPAQFALAIEEPLGNQLTPSLLFTSLLADETAFAYATTRRASVNTNKSIGAWVAVPLEHVKHSDNDESDDHGAAFMRLQTFCVPPDSGNTNSKSVHVTDFQYYAFVHDEPTGKNRLEFGSKVFVSEVGDGFSIETLVHVEMHDGAPSSLLRVFFAIAPAVNGTELSNETRTRIETSVCSALCAIWKLVALTVVDASQPTSSLSFFQSSQDLEPADIHQRLQSESKLPLHDELTSKVVAAVVAAL